jgi:hypothetical protein
LAPVARLLYMWLRVEEILAVPLEITNGINLQDQEHFVFPVLEMLLVQVQ